MWVSVCASDALPVGQAIKYAHNETAVGVFRTTDGLFAIDNTCPHYDADLHTGDVNRHGTVYCPWHQWQFSLKTGHCALNKRFDIRIFPIKEEGGQIWVDPSAGVLTPRDEV